MEKHPVHPCDPSTPPGQDSFPSQGNFRAFSCYCSIHEALTSLVATPWGLMFRVERDRSPSICRFLQRSGGGKRGRLCMFTASSGTNAGDRLVRRLGHFPLKVTQITSSSSFFYLSSFFSFHLLLPLPSPFSHPFSGSVPWHGRVPLVRQFSWEQRSREVTYSLPPSFPSL